MTEDVAIPEKTDPTRFARDFVENKFVLEHAREQLAALQKTIQKSECHDRWLQEQLLKCLRDDPSLIDVSFEIGCDTGNYAVMIIEECRDHGCNAHVTARKIVR